MSKIQSICCLVIFIVVIISMGHMFKYPLKETFKPINGTGLGYVGSDLNYDTVKNVNSMKGNLGYPGAGYIGLALPPTNYVIHSDDQPLSYGFPPIRTMYI
jgi:hypothetical protein